MTKIFVKFILFWSKLLFFFFEKPIQTQENVFPNFFSKVARESELLGSKIALWCSSNVNILQFKKKKSNEGNFLANKLNFILF